MKILRPLYLLMICMATYQTGNAQATFTTLADTVYGNAYQCNYDPGPGYTGLYYNSVIFSSGTARYMDWHVVASNFPANWLPRFSIWDTGGTYSNNTLALWNSTTGTNKADPFGSSGGYFILQLTEGYQFSPLSSGTYWIELNLKDSASSYSKNIWFVIANEPDSLGNIITGFSHVCAGDSIVLADNAASSVSWSASNGKATVSGGVVVGASGGIDTIIYSGNVISHDTGVNFVGFPVAYVDSCPIYTTAAKIITINPAPVPVVTGFGGLLYVSSAYPSYQWSTSGISILGATNSFYNPTINGSYAVTVTDSNGCTATSPAAFDANVAVPEIASVAGNISVYPNPAQSVISINAPLPVNAQLTSINGAVVAESVNTNKMNLNKVASGIYLLSIYDPATGIKLKTVKVSKVN